MTETRTISHLLHPPLLDETGFASAARWYVEGFAKRSGIPTSLDMPEDLGRLPSSLELALFRVLQESLTNVHRHSKSRKADVSLRLDRGQVVLRGRDYGKGIRATFWTAFAASALTAGWGWPGCANGSTNSAVDWKWIRTATAPGWWQLCRVSERRSSPEEFAAD